MTDEEYPFYYDWNNITQSFIKKKIKLSKLAPSRQSTFKSSISTEPWQSYSQQHLQDLLIIDIFSDKNSGFFIDLASNHWKDLSNTLTLERFNSWNGICIEPNPMYLEGLLSNRKCSIFINPVTSKCGESVLFNFNGGVFGGIIGNEYDNKQEQIINNQTNNELITVTLEQILKEINTPKIIDYFSLDVEGAEYQVLKNFPFVEYTFLTITIERPTLNIHHLLIKHGYWFVYQFAFFGECLYIHPMLKNFEEVMNKYRQNFHGKWNNEEHHYLIHPHWNGDLDSSRKNMISSIT